MIQPRAPMRPETARVPAVNRTLKRVVVFFFALILAGSALASETNSAAIGKTIAAVSAAGGELQGIPFSEVIRATTGKEILPLDLEREADRQLIAKIGAALDKVIQQMNATNSVAQKQRRINEVSSHFEAALLQALNDVPGFSCDHPRLASGKIQRSGYPDLRLVEKGTGRIVYLDPKLYEQSSRESSLRTFYFEPKKETNKVLDHAHHLIVGFAHDGKKEGFWKFLSWELVDLSRFKVRLKAEFQGSNRDLYRDAAIVGRSAD